MAFLPFCTALDSPQLATGALLLVDKPKGWTSFDVVNKVRWLLRKKYGLKKCKVGHSGTLDPMATGLLLICTGSWTKELHHLQGLDKRYEGEITLGITTDSYDAEGQIMESREVPEFAVSTIADILSGFKGEFLQYPPAFSAIKKDGKRLYELARAGKEVKTDPRKVVVHDMQMISWNTPVIQVEVHCGSGFYVRSLAFDVGAQLGCGAHLSGLIRTSVGPYRLEDAFSMETIEQNLAR